MAFPLQDAGGYGTGALGNVANDLNPGNVNSYAKITGISDTTITINDTTKITGAYETFTTGAEILIHVSATTSSSYKTYLGKWGVAKITGVNSNVLTLSTNPTAIIPASEIGRYHVQAITIAQFESLTLNTGMQIVPPMFSASTFIGGITAFKCADTLTFNGGHINLTERGIPVASKALRPLFAQESSGTLDTDTYSGWENSVTVDRFLLNSGDGAAFIVAKSLTCNSSSRIGNINLHGAQFCRGASDSVGSMPAGATNVGGSTILIAAETISNFTPSIISKYRLAESSAGQGLCRAYIASETKLTNDEGLYAYDCVSNPGRIQNLNIKDFGDGSFGDLTNPTSQLNNYARITALSSDRKTLTYTGKTTAGLAQIAVGSLVMIQVNHKNSSNTAETGRFVLAKVLADTGTKLTINTPAPDVSPSTYAMQIVSIPQCSSFKLANAHNTTPKFDGSIGGIFAIAVKGTCNLSAGKINVEAKGGGSAYGANGLKVIGNAQMSDRLPIGAGHGSVFILAQSLTMDTSTRIGATYSGATRGGASPTHAGGGYHGKMYTADKKGVKGTFGSGAAGGTSPYNHNGGYGSNSSDGDPQGAHVFIMADTISGFNQAAISTGGQGGWLGSSNTKGSSGGAGYGGGGGKGDNTEAGGGGYNGGGGGSNCSATNYTTKHWASGGGASGWAFVYCNTAVNQTTTNTIAE